MTVQTASPGAAPALTALNARARRLGRELTCLGLLRWIAGMAGRL